MITEKMTNNNPRCPRCSVSLKIKQSLKGTTFHCQYCHGVACNVGITAKITSKKAVKKLISSKPAYEKEEIECPLCKKAMAKKSINIDDNKIVIDLCCSCSILWFDKGELAKLKEVEEETNQAESPPLPLECRKAISTIPVFLALEEAEENLKNLQKLERLLNIFSLSRLILWGYFTDIAIEILYTFGAYIAFKIFPTHLFKEKEIPNKTNSDEDITLKLNNKLREAVISFKMDLFLFIIYFIWEFWEDIY